MEPTTKRRRGRPSVLRPCPHCDLMMGARELLQHRGKCQKAKNEKPEQETGEKISLAAEHLEISY